MSEFAGYVVPGVIFLLFGLKWSIESIRERDPAEKGSAMANRVRSIRRKLLCCRVKGFPAEGITKLTLTGIGMGASLVSAYPSGQLQRMSDILYATIYLFFAISGLVDVLVFYCPHSMPLGIESITLSLSFLIEGLMFHLHQTHQSFMIQHVHLFLVYTIYSTAFVLLVEVAYPEIITKFVRGYLTLLHGSWYVQTGFILDNPFKATPSSWATSHDYNNALVGISLTFAWHSAILFVLLLILLVVLRRNRGNSDQEISPRSGASETEPAISVSPECCYCCCRDGNGSNTPNDV